jgi:hypothetical protein
MSKNPLSYDLNDPMSKSPMVKAGAQRFARNGSVISGS